MRQFLISLVVTCMLTIATNDIKINLICIGNRIPMHVNITFVSLMKHSLKIKELRVAALKFCFGGKMKFKNLCDSTNKTNSYFIIWEH